jgi:hypothetical protein
VIAMGLLGRLAVFGLGTVAGAAGGIAGARLLAPRSGNDTQHAVAQWKHEIESAGEQARAETEARLEHQYRAGLRETATDQATS